MNAAIGPRRRPSSKLRHSSVVLAIAPIVLGANSGSAIQFDFTATVESVDGGTVFSEVVPGDTIDGCFEFDETVPDSIPEDERAGFYGGAVRALVVRAVADESPPHCSSSQAPCLACEDPDGLSGSINVVNSPPNMSQLDQYVVQPGCVADLLETSGASNPFVNFMIQGDDIDGVVFSDDSLPVFPPDVAEFSGGPPEQRLVHIVVTRFPSGETTEISADLETLTLAEMPAVACPEPSVRLLRLSGPIALFVLRPRPGGGIPLPTPR